MKSIEFTDLQANAAQLISKQWMLITAGTPDSFNCMTASWGGVGFLWNRPVAFIFVRPNRHTINFIEQHERLSLSFMPESYRQDLIYCGRNSGRDVDKMAHTSLKPMVLASGTPAFEDADLVLDCRKMFKTPLQQADFMDWNEVSPSFYAAEVNPLHLLYICEISDTLVRDE
ncbi:MAG: flavin reductase [Akkermansiaceae bacterium]|nr:flavin reductase [Akkermansiaceae bacterium]